MVASGGRSPLQRKALARDGSLIPNLWPYERGWLAFDLAAAGILLAIALPEQLATARLAGMPPVTGLYAFVAGSVIFGLLGSNRQMSVGADSTVAPLMAVGVSRLSHSDPQHYLAMMGILALMVGVLVSLVGLLRAGWISEFLSAPIITGFLSGVGVIILVRQLPDLFGLSSQSGTTLRRISLTARHLGNANAWALGIAIGVLVVVVAAEKIDRRLPGALVALVASTVVVAGAHLRSHGVVVLGSIAHLAPHLATAHLNSSQWTGLIPLAAVVALVIVTQSAATSHAFADKSKADDLNRDFIGVGAGSIAAGLVGAFSVNASPPRTAAVVSAKGRTQLSGLVAAAAVVALVPVSGILKDLPLATLAAILVFVASRLFRWRELVSVARFDSKELVFAVITLFTVALIGVEQGIGVAVLLAVFDRTRRSAEPKAHILGRLRGTTSWEPISADGNLEQLNGVLVVLFAAPLYFANADHFRNEVQRSLSRASRPVRHVVLDVIGMHDVDYTGVQALVDVVDNLQTRGITISIARPGTQLLASLDKRGILSDIGEHNVFGSVDEAARSVAGPESKL